MAFASDGAPSTFVSVTPDVISTKRSSSSSFASTLYNDSAQNDVVYINGTDTVALADASAESTSRVVGLALAAAADAAPVTVCSEGLMSGFTGLTPGARYFLDTATPGGITTTPADDDEQAIVQIGYAKSATVMDLQIEVIAEIDDD